MSKEEAWKLLEDAAADKDVDDFRLGVQALAKADPELSYHELEQDLRTRNLGLYLIAVVSFISAGARCGQCHSPAPTQRR